MRIIEFTVFTYILSKQEEDLCVILDKKTMKIAHINIGFMARNLNDPKLCIYLLLVFCRLAGGSHS